MPKLPVSSKVFVQTLVAVLSAVVIVVADLQSEGIELPSWVALVAVVVSPIVGYLKAENNPALSSFR